MNKKQQIMKRLVRNAQAVSPIIATLMLVLVAVGAAGAFYVWQSGWQKDVQSKTGGAGELQASLIIGGSTTVYEFGAVAAQYFQGANPNYKVNVQKGGSGAGIAAVGTGAIDIGMSSKPLSASDKTKYPDLNNDGQKDIGKELVETVVAYDAVVIIVPSARTELISIHENVIGAIYYKNGGATTIPQKYSDVISKLDGIVTGQSADQKIQWNEVPISIAKYNEVIAPGYTYQAADFCTGNTVVKIYDRSDVSGTEDTFSKHFVDTGKETLEEAGITANHVESNQVMVTTIAADANSIGFAAYGVAKAASGIRMPIMRLSADSIDVDPTSSNFVTQAKNLQTECAKKLYFITVGQPQNDIKVFIDFCLAPEMNSQICKAGGYISKY
ncbi:MAG: substrate-binding domain-containing protein [Candidatus Thermoplasmatota archaeon]